MTISPEQSQMLRRYASALGQFLREGKEFHHIHGSEVPIVLKGLKRMKIQTEIRWAKRMAAKVKRTPVVKMCNPGEFDVKQFGKEMRA